MTVIGNNSANNTNPLANISVTGAKGTDGSTGVTSFLDIISMLSSSAQALDPSSNANLLVTQVEPEAEPSTLALLQKFLDQEQISVPLLSEISSEDISTGTASKFIDFLNKVSRTCLLTLLFFLSTISSLALDFLTSAKTANFSLSKNSKRFEITSF